MAADPDDHISLTRAMFLLHERHGLVVSYGKLHRRALSGAIPARWFGGRLFLAARDLDMIADTLRLKAQPEPPRQPVAACG